MIIEYGKNKFNLGLYGYEICLWDKNGCTSLINLKYDESTPFETVAQSLKQCMNDYNKGIIHCGDCNKPLSEDEIAGRYFAGVYCSECWEREWKEKESNENYD